jgi:hypothetical protein
MSWAERTLMLLRQEFVRLVEAGGIPMSQLCQRFYKGAGTFKCPSLAQLRSKEKAR